ncbi:hypothetical protein EON79_17265 [bacterium]|nr:MAG: hypothetical protein EON79_17265 [bacterium]
MVLASVLALGVLATNRVVPGESLGQIKIGDPATTLAKLGRPYAGDAAMQKAWATWLGKGRARLDVYTVVESDRPVIRIIRATSPSFRTASGLGPGVSEKRMRRAYPAARDIVTYRPPSGGAPVHVFDDIEEGFAFEVQRGQCVGIAVHRASHGLNSEMLGIASYLREPLQRS